MCYIQCGIKAANSLQQNKRLSVNTLLYFWPLQAEANNSEYHLTLGKVTMNVKVTHLYSDVMLVTKTTMHKTESNTSWKVMTKY